MSSRKMPGYSPAAAMELAWWKQPASIAAARTLRLPKTTVSRKVQELEARLGAQLLHRTTRKLGLTEAGNVYYEHSQSIARELDETGSAVTPLQETGRETGREKRG